MGRFSFLLFMGGAIFAESEIGFVREETVASCGVASKFLFGDDIIDGKKTEIDGQRSERGLIQGLTSIRTQRPYRRREIWSGDAWNS